MSRTSALLLALATAVTLSTAIVSARQFAAPAGWKWVTDSPATLATGLEPAEGQWLFGTMAPGWHITTRPGVLLFEPSYTARARFALESESFLFPGTSTAGFGLFVGGANLEGRPRYAAFLIRRDGNATVQMVDAGQTTTLYPWTPSPAIVIGHEKDAVKNVIRLEAETANILFLVNGQKIAEIPRDSRFDGVVGLRIGDQLNLHVTNVDLTHRLALPRAVK